MLNFELITKAEINSNHFPFFTVKDALLSKEFHPSLVSDFPNISKGGSFPLEAISPGKSIQMLVKELQGSRMRKILEQKFQVNLKDKPVVTTFRGYSRIKDGKIHSDSKTKIITVLIYLNDQWNHKKGLLRLLKDNNNLKNYIEEIPATMGSLVAFKVTENCWHGFQPYEGKRCSIQLNYLHESALSQHNFRHKLSSFFKKYS
tara:strand:+ start:348 stop:956 length:609 start_codon:yes stop_codon:yes gene_type:complete